MATWTKKSESTAPTWTKQTENSQEKFGAALGTGQLGYMRLGVPKDGWLRKKEKSITWTKQTEN